VSGSRFDLRGSVCLLTGASGGIGRATAQLLAQGGAQLVLQGRDAERLQQVAAETGGQAVSLDLTAPGAAQLLFENAKRLKGRVDVLVNNAGAGWAGRFADMPPERGADVLALNLMAPIALTRAVLPDMIAANRGRIVFVSSIAGYLGVRDEAVYSAAKAAIIAFAESLRSELAGTGLRTAVVSPAVIDTAFFANRGRPYTRSWPRPLPPETVGRAILRAIQSGRFETVVPASMWLSIRVKGVLPSAYRTLADRFG
jgi:short-subunit dehydrogenase